MVLYDSESEGQDLMVSGPFNPPNVSVGHKGILLRGEGNG